MRLRFTHGVVSDSPVRTRQHSRFLWNGNERTDEQTNGLRLSRLTLLELSRRTNLTLRLKTARIKATTPLCAGLMKWHRKKRRHACKNLQKLQPVQRSQGVGRHRFEVVHIQPQTFQWDERFEAVCWYRRQRRVIQVPAWDTQENETFSKIPLIELWVPSSMVLN